MVVTGIERTPVEAVGMSFQEEVYEAYEEGRICCQQQWPHAFGSSQMSTHQSSDGGKGRQGQY